MREKEGIWCCVRSFVMTTFLPYGQPTRLILHELIAHGSNMRGRDPLEFKRILSTLEIGEEELRQHLGEMFPVQGSVLGRWIEGWRRTSPAHEEWAPVFSVVAFADNYERGATVILRSHLDRETHNNATHSFELSHPRRDPFLPESIFAPPCAAERCAPSLRA